jgi:hypothetical protein
MSFWNLAVTMGNLWTLLARETVNRKDISGWISNNLGVTSTAFLMMFFAGFAFLAALAFRAYARRYKSVDNYHAHGTAAAPVDEGKADLPKATARLKDDGQDRDGD